MDAQMLTTRLNRIFASAYVAFALCGVSVYFVARGALWCIVPAIFFGGVGLGFLVTTIVQTIVEVNFKLK